MHQQSTTQQSLDSPAGGVNRADKQSQGSEQEIKAIRSGVLHQSVPVLPQAEDPHQGIHHKTGPPKRNHLHAALQPHQRSTMARVHLLPRAGSRRADNQELRTWDVGEGIPEERLDRCGDELGDPSGGAVESNHRARQSGVEDLIVVFFYTMAIVDMIIRLLGRFTTTRLLSFSRSAAEGGPTCRFLWAGGRDRGPRSWFCGGCPKRVRLVRSLSLCPRC